MHWNIAAECVSIIILLIIWVYSLKGSLLPTLKNRLFQGCIFVTFCAMCTNILSTIMIAYVEWFPIWLTALITMVYYIFTPLMGLVYFSYSAAVIYMDKVQLYRILKLGCIPGLLYVGLVLANPVSGILFHIDRVSGYSRGPLVVITYIVFYAYCMASMILVMYNCKRVERQIYRILASFPVIAVVVIIVQQFYPEIILSGSAATSALLIIYLHLQNKQLTLDPITGVPNRSELFNMIEYLMKKKPAQSLAIMVISLRGFKRINNSYGQSTGDKLLKMLSQYLALITPNGNIYRFSGDEFAILIEERNEQLAKWILDKFKERLQSPWLVDEYHCMLQAVVGVAEYPHSAATPESLIGAVEYAVSAAKKEEMNWVCYCDQAMMDKLLRREHIIRILKEKLADNSFDLYYQPIISLKSGKYLFAESLMRISDSKLGFLSPGEFIPIAEETGMIIKLTYQVLDKVCKFVNRLLEAGIELQAIHVNFSAIQFSEENLAEKVCEIIKRNQTPLSAIKIEFTESTIAENTGIVTEFAVEMAKNNISMGLDDFGTGYSNIASVIDIPFSTLKLDKSLIWSAMEHEKSALIVKNLTKAFHDLDMVVLAEGVENEEQAQFVKDCGIDQVQGYYYARPMPEKEAEEFLRKHWTKSS